MIQVIAYLILGGLVVVPVLAVVLGLLLPRKTVERLYTASGADEKAHHRHGHPFLIGHQIHKLKGRGH